MRIEANLFREAAVLEQVEKSLEEQGELTPDALSEISEALESLDTGFRDRVISAKKKLVDREISLILSRAKDLESSVTDNHLDQVAAKVDALKNSLLSFENRHGDDYSFIHEAHAFLDCVEKLQEHNGFDNALLKKKLDALVDLLSARLQKEIPPEEAELIFDLFELAEAVHHHKKGIEERLLDLKSRLKSKNQVIKIDRSQDNDDTLKKVLLEVGHEIAGKTFEGDTEGWFKELDQYTETPSFVFRNSTILA